MRILTDALAQMMRVLKSGGQLIFCEHGLAPHEGIVCWQKRINRAWAVFAGGCLTDMPIISLIRDAGFEMECLDEMYLSSKPKSLDTRCGEQNSECSGHLALDFDQLHAS